MPKKDSANLAELIQVLDSGMTLADILYDLGWVRKERERHRVKGAKQRAAKKPPAPPATEPPAPGSSESQG